MLDMIELYGYFGDLADRWCEIPMDFSNSKRVKRALQFGTMLKPAPSSLSHASVLRAVQADERYRIGRWLDSGRPQYLDWSLKSADGEFAIMLAIEEMRVFLLPPDGDQADNVSLGILKACVKIDDQAHLNTPLYW